MICACVEVQNKHDLHSCVMTTVSDLSVSGRPECAPCFPSPSTVLASSTKESKVRCPSIAYTRKIHFLYSYHTINRLLVYIRKRGREEGRRERWRERDGVRHKLTNFSFQCVTKWDGVCSHREFLISAARINSSMGIFLMRDFSPDLTCKAGDQFLGEYWSRSKM